MSAYAAVVSIRKLFATMVALALLAAPSAVFAAMPAAAPSHHAMQAMQMGECQSAPSAPATKAPLKSCCMSMCLALAVAPEAPLDRLEMGHSSDYFVAQSVWHGFLGEIATPPPRLS